MKALPGLARAWPLWLTVAGVLASTAVLLSWAEATTGGNFAYPLDDTYIHLATARTLAESGTWGINPGEFASSSSSPLWTVILAVCLGLLGDHVTLPLALNVVAAVMALSVAWRLAAAVDERPWVQAAGLAALCVVAPLPYLIETGMEHTLHLALTLAVLWAAGPLGERQPTPTEWVRLVVLAAAVALTRYEATFLRGWVGLWLGLRGSGGARLRSGVGALDRLLPSGRGPSGRAVRSCRTA